MSAAGRTTECTGCWRAPHIRLLTIQLVHLVPLDEQIDALGDEIAWVLSVVPISPLGGPPGEEVGAASGGACHRGQGLPYAPQE
jgi:hypothetical protein